MTCLEQAHELGTALVQLRKEVRRSVADSACCRCAEPRLPQLPRTSTRAAHTITHAAEALQNKRDLVSSTKKRIADLTEQLQTIQQVQPMVAARVEKGA